MVRCAWADMALEGTCLISEPSGTNPARSSRSVSRESGGSSPPFAFLINTVITVSQPSPSVSFTVRFDSQYGTDKAGFDVEADAHGYIVIRRDSLVLYTTVAHLENLLERFKKWADSEGKIRL
jgi:hypothetical protein